MSQPSLNSPPEIPSAQEKAQPLSKSHKWSLFGLRFFLILLLAVGYSACTNVNLADENGETPLCSASRKGHTETVALLIKKGADVNLADKWRRPPLNCASGNGHTETVKLLIAAGADVNKKSNRGWTPLQEASIHGHTKIVKLLKAAGARR